MGKAAPRRNLPRTGNISSPVQNSCAGWPNARDEPGEP